MLQRLQIAHDEPASPSGRGGKHGPLPSAKALMDGRRRGSLPSAHSREGDRYRIGPETEQALFEGGDQPVSLSGDASGRRHGPGPLMSAASRSKRRACPGGGGGGRGPIRQPFHLHDFSWEDQAFAVIGRYCPGLERLLDDMFRETISLTDFTCVPPRHSPWCQRSSSLAR